MSRVIHFEIHATDPERIAKFYAEVFGWTIEEWKVPGVEIAPENRYWAVLTAPAGSAEPGIDGGIVVRNGDLPRGGEAVASFVCTISVPAFDEFARKIESAGGRATTAKMPVMGIGWLGYFTDPEGNSFGIMEEDKQAK